MSLLGRRGFESFVVKLPAVTLVEQWDSLVAKVGGKVFALAAAGGGSIAFKVSETAFEGLTGLEGIAQAPYFAKGQWVSVSKGADVSEADLKAYVREAHRIIASKLTRKLQAELGLAELVAARPRKSAT